MKRKSTFFPQERIRNAQQNAQDFQWAQTFQQKLLEKAEPWVNISDMDLWNMMFDCGLKRSWMVLSDGVCPICGNPVPMYSWRIDAFAHPWKLQCPHCQEFFPKNDFYPYYLSGLDSHHIFHPELADHSLLYNTEHPSPDDPLHLFGVDDGNGYQEGDKTWLFIATYLVYGQWKQMILGGITNLAQAYAVSGEKRYAHKAAILLDRVADLFPTFDWESQGVLYEGTSKVGGFVSYCIDSCGESRALGVAYDQIFSGIQNDMELVAFLSLQAQKCSLSNSKRSIEDIQRNIESNILSESIRYAYDKNQCNYPHCHITDMILRSVLNWEEDREEILQMMGEVLQKATAVDGLTGEKGTASYSTMSPSGLAVFLSMFTGAEPDFAKMICEKFPRLREGYLFHVDTWCLQKYYPHIGDDGTFSQQVDHYVGIHTEKGSLPQNRYSLDIDYGKDWLWRLYCSSGDIRLAQTLYLSLMNPDEGYSPCSIFSADAAQGTAMMDRLIADHGTEIQTGSVCKDEWHVAILRSGQGAEARASWICFDSRYMHGHYNGMNLGLFAKGYDLMADFGYVPVQFGGGWESPHVKWYLSTAAHNTVVVDGKNHCGEYFEMTAGKRTLWMEQGGLHAMRFSGPSLIGGQQFERGIYQVDLPDGNFYLVDIFRVRGGKEHIKYMHTNCAELSINGLNLIPGPKEGCGGFMRNYQCADVAHPGWQADFHLSLPAEDDTLPENIHVLCTDFTEAAGAMVAEAWVAKDFNSNEQMWIPRIMTYRSGMEEGLFSTFVSVIEPYEDTPRTSSRRLPIVCSDHQSEESGEVAIWTESVAGIADVLISCNVEARDNCPAEASVQLPDGQTIRFCGDVLFLRVENGKPAHITAWNLKWAELYGCRIEPLHGDCTAFDFRDGHFYEVSMDSAN